MQRRAFHADEFGGTRNVVAETVEFLAFLDIAPLAIGHVLVIPKKEVDYIFDLDDATYTGLQIFAKIYI